MTYYAATIFETSIGLSPFLSRLLSACNGTEYWMASWIAIFTIEKFGRRPLMMFGAAGMSMSMAVLAGTTSSFGSSSMGLAAVSDSSTSIQYNETNMYCSDCIPFRFQLILRHRLARHDMALSS